MTSKTYRFGFLCLPRDRSASRPAVVAQWQHIPAAFFDFHVHPEMPVHHVTDRHDRTVFLFGDMFVAHGERTVEEALLEMAAGDRAITEDISGRFVIFIVDGDKASVLNDPLGSQPVFYSGADGGVAASHSALIAEALGLSKSPRTKAYMASSEYMARTTRFLPGDLSLYEGVRLLVPNNELSLPGTTTSRYWPRRDITAASYESILSLWDEYFGAYAEYMAPRYSPVLGLTGGVDSRSVIATLRHKQLEMRVETWDKMPDAEGCRIPEMVRHLGLDHRWVDTTRRSGDAEFRAVREAAKSAAGYTRGTPLLPAQMAEGAGQRDLFIYGHGPGVTAGAFNREAKTWLPDDPVKRAYTLYAGNVRHDAGPEYEKFTVGAYESFFERANYSAELFGTDIGDLLYWESRMGNWASQQMAAVAVGLPVHAGVNSRRLFQEFWGAPIEERVGKKIQREIMAHFDPVLAEL